MLHSLDWSAVAQLGEVFDPFSKPLFASQYEVATDIAKPGKQELRLSRRAAYESEKLPEIPNSLWNLWCLTFHATIALGRFLLSV